MPCNECAVQIRNIETQAGYAVLQGESLNLIEGFSELIHIVDIRDIRDTIQKLKTSISNNYNINDGWLILNLNRKISELEHSLQTLNIHTESRNKRALIDVGGRLIRWIFGNMDDEDRTRIENHFENIDFKQRNIIDNLNKQVKINNEMQNYLQNIRLIVEQHRNWFNKTYVGEIDKSLKITKYNNFVLLINEVKSKIEQVQENIVMSKYGIASKFFLTNDEIDHFNIDSLKMKHMRSSMGCIETNIIVFVLMIPNFTDTKYRTEIVLPIPNREFMQLDIKITKTVTVNTTTYLIKEENILNKMIVIKSCISNILRNNYTDCHKINVKEKSVVEIEVGNLLLINIDSTLYDSCTNFSYPLKGNYIVKIEQCQISIDDYKIKRFESRLNIIVPNFNILPINITETLPEINFTHVNEIIENLENKHTSYNFYVLYILFFLIILYYILQKFKNCTGIRRDSNLNGEGVICDAHVDTHIDNPVILPLSLRA